jgi:Skp family chaperone for outer membrane proteins
MSSPKRRLWEFQGPLICRVLGLAFDEEEQGKILKKLNPGAQSVAPAHPHGVLVQTCAQPNPVSKYMDGVLEERFEPYRKQLDGLDQRDISRLIDRKDGYRDVPLPALIWFALRHQHQDIDEIEARVFSAIHAMEHRALRLYDSLSRVLPDSEPENVLDKLKESLRLNDELQKRYNRSQHKNEELRAELEKIGKDRLRLTEALGEQRQLNERLSQDIEKLGGQLALDHMESIRKENDLLAQEVKSLTEELMKKQPGTAAKNLTGRSSDSEANAEDECITIDSTEQERDIKSPTLNGKKVAFVGGLESFVPHYQQVVEHLNGTFYFHSGNCTGGKGELEKLVEKADVVFCPVDFNSHHACRHVKKACKLTGKPCCFLRSSSLSTFRRELAGFAGRVN